MTDSKSWLWRKKSSGKNASVADEVDPVAKRNEEEIRMFFAKKAEVARDFSDLSGKLSSALSDCEAKDKLAKKNAKAAQEALAGLEKAEAKAVSLKQELDEAMKERETYEQRTCHLDSALKECMQQLRFVREDQEKRIHDVLRKASKELEQTNTFWEEKLTESETKIANLSNENSQLNNMLLLKEEAIEDLTQQRAHAEGRVNTLLARLEGMQKDNNSLIYEVRILEKELDIRNEERDFNLRTADASHKQHLENVKKIAKLEGECQRLRVLVRKRLPGPAALAQMKNEVDTLQRDSFGNRRRRSSSNLSNAHLDYVGDNYPDSPSKKVNTLSEKIYTLEEENNSLREALQQQLNELQISRNMYVNTVSKLSQVETQLEESPKSQLFGQTRRNSIMSHDLSLASMSDVGSDDKVSCAGSWACALISELENIRDGKDKVALPSKPSEISDMNNFMDDFADMEKLALVCTDKPRENSSVTKSESSLTSLSETPGKELVPIVNGNTQMPSEPSKSVSKLIEIIEGLKLSSPVSDGLQSRVLQWKTSDLSSVLQNFVRVCGNLQNGKVDFEVFTQEMASALEWIVNHCFSHQDVSSMKNEIEKQFEWDETISESEMQRGLGEGGKSNDLSRSADSEKQEQMIQSLRDECESLRNQIEKSESTIESLQSELEALKLSNPTENLKMTIEDRDSQLSAASQKLVFLEVELKKKDDYCEELDSKCLDLKLQVERLTNIDSTENVNQDEKQLQSEQEFSAASEKLAECQETILNLGKQLRALATSRDAVVSDKFISTPTNTNTSISTINNEMNQTNQGSSLLGKMLAEDDANIEQLRSPKTKEVICPPKDAGYEPAMEYVRCNSGKKYVSRMAVNSLAIVPSKKQNNLSGGFIMKLLRRKKKGGSKKTGLPFAA